MEQGTVAASLFIDLAAQLDARGVRPADFCARAGVNAAFLELPHDRLAGADAQRLWNAAVELTGDSLLGLHLAERFRTGALHILGYVLLNCANGYEAIERLSRYASLLNDGLRVYSQQDARQLTVRLAAVEFAGNVLLTDARQVMETMAAGIVLTLRSITGGAVIPLHVGFRHSPGGALSEYQRIFGVAVRFTESTTCVSLRRKELDQPFPAADPTLLRVFEEEASSRLEALRRAGAMSGRVIRAIAFQLSGTAPDLTRIASQFAMSARSVQRELQDEGTTYQELLDEARHQIALQRLRQPGVTAAEVALLLGYSEASAFSRAFRRWTGTTPSGFARRGVTAE